MNNLERRRKQNTLDSQLHTSSQKLGMLINTFIWGYDNAGDREAKRAAMWADPDWITYTGKCKLGALINQENKLMRPVDFFAEPKR